MNAIGLLANIAGWPLIQLSIARISVIVPEKYFASSDCISSMQLPEVNFYRKVLHVRRWKHRLPDGAGWVGGGFPKRRLKSHDHRYLLRFASESRRGEIAHWCMLAFFPVFYLWNPPWASAVMTMYAFAANIPCIVVQRYNRFTLLQIFARRRAISTWDVQI